MLSFLKTKRGFTLVELMIVVVIMAILVAVAVPLYSAVTTNAKKRTCVDNQRQIISSISNYIMTKELKIEDEQQVTIKTEADNYATVSGDDGTINADLIKTLFKTLPICPVENNVIVITVRPNTGSDSTSTDVTTECQNAAGTPTDHTV